MALQTKIVRQPISLCDFLKDNLFNDAGNWQIGEIVGFVHRNEISCPLGELEHTLMQLIIANQVRIHIYTSTDTSLPQKDPYQIKFGRTI